MPEQKKKRRDGFLAVTKQDAFFMHFADYEEKESLKPLRDFLREKKYTVSDTSTTYRVLSSWASAGLLPQGVNLEGWRRFTVVEAVWIDAVKHMRDFGVTFEEIVNIRKAVVKWDAKEQRYPEFEYYVSKALLSHDDPYIVVLNDGADIGSSQEIERAKMLSGSTSMLLVSLKVSLNSLGLAPEPPMTLLGLTQDEKEALYAIRSGGDKELALKVKDSKISELEVTEEIEVSNWERLKKELIRKGVYASSTSQIVDGKEVSKKVTRKKKF